MSFIFSGTDPKISKREKENNNVAREIAREGIVLLKNEGVLPVHKQKIALFGFGARHTVKGGTGSGSVNERHSVTVEEGLEAAGYLVTTKKWLDRCEKDYNEQYTAWRQAREQEIVGITDIMQILATVGKTPFIFPTGVAITEEDVKEAETDIAVYVVSRQAGEGNDRALAAGDFLLDENERNNIAFLSSHFAQVVLVINAGSQVDISPVIGSVKAIVYLGQAGQAGGSAFADIFSGKVNPSGKLTATWVKRYEDIPYGEKYGYLGDPKQQDYLEDIYVGYRYYDTFGVQPLFPFGFGLSYTKFRILSSKVRAEEQEIVVSGKVENIGEHTGKETVEVYVSVPFGKTGAEYQRLVGYCKTPLIAKGENCKFEVRFALSELAKFDEARAAFVLEAGDYILRVGNSSRDTEPVCRLTVAKEALLEQCEHICPAEPLKVLRPEYRTAEPNDSLPTLAIGTGGIKTVTHSYETKEVALTEEDRALLSAMTVKELASFVVGGGFMGDKVVSVFGSSGTTTCALYEKYGIPNLVMADGPAGLNLANKYSVDENGNAMALAVPPAYDFGIFGSYLREMIGKTATGIVHYQYATAWPSGAILAQTWNRELCASFGRSVAREMTEFGVSVWLAPGMNIQRNPLCGRNFEYYSEDPLLSGTTAKYVVIGVQENPKCTVAVKHFCCNNMELLRDHSSSNLSERALREIYLKNFRKALEEKPLTVMSSYNLVNGVYSPNDPDLLIRVLRGEWGFEGLVMTDWSACGEDKAVAWKAIASENDLVMPGSEEQAAEVAAAVERGELPLDTLYRCAARVLVLTRRTAAIEFHQ